MAMFTSNNIENQCETDIDGRLKNKENQITEFLIQG